MESENVFQNAKFKDLDIYITRVKFSSVVVLSLWPTQYSTKINYDDYDNNDCSNKNINIISIAHDFPYFIAICITARNDSRLNVM